MVLWFLFLNLNITLSANQRFLPVGKYLLKINNKGSHNHYHVKNSRMIYRVNKSNGFYIRGGCSNVLNVIFDMDDIFPVKTGILMFCVCPQIFGEFSFAD